MTTSERLNMEAVLPNSIISYWILSNTPEHMKVHLPYSSLILSDTSDTHKRDSCLKGLNIKTKSHPIILIPSLQFLPFHTIWCSFCQAGVHHLLLPSICCCPESSPTISHKF